MVYQRPERGGSYAIEVVRVQDGKVFTLTRGQGVDAARACWIGASHTVSFRAPAPGGSFALVAQDFVEGTDTSATRHQLTAPERDAAPETFAISPDGTKAVISLIDEASAIVIAESVEGIH